MATMNPSMATAIGVLHTLLTVSVGVLSGIALCLNPWVMPIIHLSSGTATRIKQFNHIIHLGTNVLLPSSRVMLGLLLSLTYLSYQHDDPVVHARWMHYVATMLCLLPISPWETTLIFPINDKIAAMGRELTKTKRESFADQRDREVEELLKQWSRWHVGRIVMPMLATSVLVGGGVGALPF